MNHSNTKPLKTRTDPYHPKFERVQYSSPTVLCSKHRASTQLLLPSEFVEGQKKSRFKVFLVFGCLLSRSPLLIKLTSKHITFRLMLAEWEEPLTQIRDRIRIVVEQIQKDVNQVRG